jgi:hypothetical protein
MKTVLALARALEVSPAELLAGYPVQSIPFGSAG